MGADDTGAVNGQVILDGTDTLWVTSVKAGEGPRLFHCRLVMLRDDRWPDVDEIAELEHIRLVRQRLPDFVTAPPGQEVSRRVEGWAEQDAYTRWRRMYRWRPGELAWINAERTGGNAGRGRQEIQGQLESNEHP